MMMKKKNVGLCRNFYGWWHSSVSNFGVRLHNCNVRGNAVWKYEAFVLTNVQIKEHINTKKLNINKLNTYHNV